MNFVVKANMWGSVVALTDSLEKLLKPHKDEVRESKKRKKIGEVCYLYLFLIFCF